MPSGTYNAGSTGVANRSIDLQNDTIELLLLSTETPYVFDPDHATVAAILAAGSEVAVGGYVGGHAGAGRRVLAGKTITTDVALNRTVFDANDPAPWAALAIGEEVAAAVVFRRGANDAASVPLFYLDFAGARPTNGGSFQLQFSAQGVGFLQNGVSA